MRPGTGLTTLHMEIDLPIKFENIIVNRVT
jgi:hypothetical protein